MRSVSKLTLISIVFFNSTTHAGVDLSLLKPAADYSVKVFSPNVKGARSMTRSPQGTLFVGTRMGNVYAIRNGEVFTIAKGLEEPNGVAFRDGALYVADISKIYKFEKIEKNLKNPPKPVMVYDRLPKDLHHGWKFIAFGPDGFLYVPVGAPCNVCKSEDPRYASILRFKTLDGKDPEVFSSGIRNTVGFAWNPQNKELWFTDNGRNMLGDDLPSDELNHAPKIGMHFGFPYCHQGDSLDPEFGKGHACSEYSPPELKLGAHVASLGMRFLDENTIILAEHGSWNRSKKVGYRVMRVKLKNGKVASQEPLLEGFLQPEEKVIGRPVDIEILPDHSVLVSDDESGAIYQLTPKIK